MAHNMQHAINEVHQGEEKPVHQRTPFQMDAILHRCPASARKSDLTSRRVWCLLSSSTLLPLHSRQCEGNSTTSLLSQWQYKCYFIAFPKREQSPATPNIRSDSVQAPEGAFDQGHTKSTLTSLLKIRQSNRDLACNSQRELLNHRGPQ
jgi:hypothetical protein